MGVLRKSAAILQMEREADPDSGFSIIPNWIIRRSDLSGGELLVYLALFNHADRYGFAWPSMKTICKEARMSDATAKKAMRALEERGLLERAERPQDGAANLTNMYRVVIFDHEGGGGKYLGGVGSKSSLDRGQDFDPEVDTFEVDTFEGDPDFELDIPVGSRTPLAFPFPFQVTPEMRAWAEKNCPSVVGMAATGEFVTYWREGEGKGRRKKNWVLAWRNWLKREHARNVQHGWVAPVERKVIRGGRVVS